MPYTAQTPHHQSFALVCDSSCDIDSHALAAAGVYVVPFYIQNDKIKRRECNEISSQEFYAEYTTSRARFVAAAPSTEDYLSLFEELQDKGYTQVLSLHASQRIANSYESALEAARRVAQIKVYVLETKCISAGLALVTAAALRSRLLGHTLEETAEHAARVANTVRFMLILPPQRTSIYQQTRSLLPSVLTEAKRLHARALSLRRVISVEKNGEARELYQSTNLQLLAGRIVRTMSLISQKEGTLTYLELSAGIPKFLSGIEKPLDTNEFESHLAGALNAHPSNTIRFGIGAVGVAFVPSEYVPADFMCAFLAQEDLSCMLSHN